MNGQRLNKALKKAWQRNEDERWIYGLMGKIKDGVAVFDVEGRANYVYVRIRNQNGAQTSPPARNDPGVAHSAGLPVRMRMEGTTLVIDSEVRREDLATTPVPPGSGVPVHIHDTRYFTEAEHINVSAGAADAGKPIVLDAAGLIDDSMLPSTVLTDTDDLPEGVVNLYYTVERAQDAVGAMLVDTPTIDLAYVDATPALTATVIDGSITFAKLQDIATDSLIGRDTAGSGDPETITLGASLSMTGAQVLQRAALTGDVTASANSNTTAIAANAVLTAMIADAQVTLAKMANLAADTIIGRANGAGTGVPTALTATQVFAILQTGLDARYGDINLISNYLLVDPAFLGLTNAKRYTTIGAALTASTTGDTIVIAPGVYTENLTMSVAGVTLEGSGQPRFDSGTGRLVDGTVIRGTIGMSTTVGLTVRNLGVDVVGMSDPTDCISSSNNSGSVFRNFENLTLLGNGTAGLGHGLYCGGNHMDIRNVRVYDCYHGIAIHGSYINISNAYLYRCGGTGLIIKSKGGVNCHHVNVNNVLLQGETTSSATRSGAIYLQSADTTDSVRYCNISNVTAKNCVNGVVNLTRLDAEGAVSDINFVNIASDGNLDAAGVGDYWIKTGNNLAFTNCRSTNRSAGYGFRMDTGDNVGDVYLSNCLADTTGSGPHNGTFKALGLNGRVPGSIAPLYVALADDTAIGLTLAETSGVVILSQGNSQTWAGVIDFRAQTSPYCFGLVVGSALNTTTGVLAGTTGTDVKTTVSAHTDGKFYIENRTGATRTYRVTFMG